MVVVGAGLSGIGAGYRLQTECPERSYVILEARDAIGGTWDLFRYPGVRSDSDMFTLGYAFRPWREAKSIADGDTIRDYIRSTAEQFRIEEKIRFRTRVVAADWSSEQACWTVTVEQSVADAADADAADAAVERRTLTCDFLYSCTGYYDYASGYTPDFPGVADYQGTVVHPQFWPEDLDYAGKRVVIIGSGATAVTLVPSMVRDAEHVTMLQRSPSWIGAVPGRDKLADQLRAVLPPRVAHRIIRAKNIAFTIGVYQFCRRRPAAARKMLTKLANRFLKDEQMVREHFTPTYNPWEQRLCAAPDADFFRAIRGGKADVVTDHIEAFMPEGIRLVSGKVLEADVVVTATGLRLLALGGIAPSVDGVEVPLAKQFVWRGAMVTGIPNFAVCIGYTNASWTLRGDLTSRLVCKVLNHMKARGYSSVVPVPDGTLRERPLLDLSSGYIQRSIQEFPRSGHRSPWRVRQNYILDAATTMRTDLDRTLRPTRREKAGVSS
ncbi:putative monooxygenase [Catenulispora acidiphila DSM 44928]|uniref:Putative monooxygenase n=1 Tax=Catenulispora acidiphila (strain DSM 44928 / JCM 14897 / NBRC 102108 / NRRL B-24433 / ID139908) TaxID=479433 RepID=C7QC39_CATAD|nr:putative monooxygenase [Catenulispora acidiphila DSM 44928]